MPVKLGFSLGLGFAAMLLAQAEHHLLDSYGAVVMNLGLAGLITLGSFGLLSWWFKKNINEQREDMTRLIAQSELERQNQRDDVQRMARRITDLEDKLFTIVADSTATQIRIAESLERNTEQMLTMTVTMNKLADVLDGRPCVAMDAMAPEVRKQIYQLIREQREEA